MVGWTKEWPAEEGWYWVKNSDTGDEAEMYFSGHRLYGCVGPTPLTFHSMEHPVSWPFVPPAPPEINDED